METAEKEEFLKAYTKVLTTAWTNDEYSQRLATDPKQALREFGIEVPADAEVEITRHLPEEHGDPDINVALTKWEAGESTGHYVMSVPEAAELNTEELSEQDLEAVAAGLTISKCCCTPCCCCA